MKLPVMLIGLMSLLLVACEGDKQDAGSDAKPAEDMAQPAEMSTPFEQPGDEGVQPGELVGPEAADSEAPPVVDATVPAEAQAMSGEQVFKKHCFACHMTGAANAPKVGDVDAWAPRIEKGMEALVLAAIEGVPGTAMPAKGTCGSCTEQELQDAIEFMVDQSR